MKLEEGEEEVWWDRLKEGPRGTPDSQIPGDNLDKMLCVNPDELCVVTFIPVEGANVEKRRDKIVETLQDLIDYWGESKVRLFWVDVGEFPDADEKLQVSKKQATVIAFSSVEDTYSTLPASFSPRNLDAWIEDLKSGKGVNLRPKPEGEIILLGHKM